MEKTYRLAGGVGCALVTPFDERGEVDYESARRLACFLVENGVEHLVVNGTTGEAPTTSDTEKIKLISAVRKAVGEHVYITAGAGSNDTRHAVSLALQAQEAGADGLLVVTPYYSRPGQEGAYRHLETVAQAVELPVYLYDIPARTGLALAEETIERLAQLDNVVGVKDSTGQVERGSRLATRTGLAWYSGDDGLNYSWLAQRANGVISVVAQVAPALVTRQVRSALAGELAEALSVSERLYALVEAVMGSGPGAVMAKCALVELGVIAHAGVRLPLVPAAPESVVRLRSVLQS